jgi:hypothetical protein
MSLRLLFDTETRCTDKAMAMKECKLSRILSIVVRGMRSEHAMSNEDNIEIANIEVNFAVSAHTQSEGEYMQKTEPMLIRNVFRDDCGQV